LNRLAEEINLARLNHPDIRILIGHGSGSFGHIVAEKHGTIWGVHTQGDWIGFAEVWREAAVLNHFVMDALSSAGIPCIAFPPSGAISARNRSIIQWEIQPIRAALDAGLIPVVYGDVVFDSARGGTILSTEELFVHLGRLLHPERILLAGRDEGVWTDYPECTQLIPEITPTNFLEIAPSLGDSSGTDVTGGMASKVQLMLSIVEDIPGLEVLIFSGNQKSSLYNVLSGARLGTRLHADR
jgi:isopentenyl phosphate kinase